MERDRPLKRDLANEPGLEELLAPLRKSFQGRLASPLGGYVYRFTIFLILERKQAANQDVVLIEHTTAWLVESVP
jgi:hypothetical protein